MNDPLITTRQAALLHDVAESTIRAWVARDILRPTARIGRTSYYRTSDVDEAEYLARTRDVSGRSNTRLT
jgi:DNA-binding transcriptional MerR regulator